MKIISVVGARPNFMKVAPIHKVIGEFNLKNNKSRIQHLICHTGQHYDTNMSKIFFEELELPKPDYYLGVGGGSHAEQTAKVMIEFEKVLLNEKPDIIIVVGDVNSTIACSLTAVKLGIKIAHVEAGLRSFDKTMPEEINRILTDSISDYLFVTEKSGLENLKNEGISNGKVHFVGHVMIDSLIYYLPKLDKNVVNKFGLSSKDFILVTMHRPSNVDNLVRLIELLEMLKRISKKKKILFPIHPRTKNNIDKFNLNLKSSPNLILTEPLGYLDFISLLKESSLILTDSGGIQEESTYLGIPCVTLRTTTERPITVEVGTNYLVGDKFIKAEKRIDEILTGNFKEGKIPELWDGKAAQRVVTTLLNNKF